MANDGGLRKKRIIVCLLLGLFLIFVAVYSMYLEKNTALGLRLLDEEGIASLIEGRTQFLADSDNAAADFGSKAVASMEKWGEITYRGSRLTFDKRNGCFYIIPADEEKPLKGEIEAKSDTELYFVDEEAFGDMKKSILEGHRFKMLMVKQSEYCLADVIFTTMPMLVIDTNGETVFQDDISAKLSGFGSHAFECEGSVRKGDSGRVYKLRLAEKMSVLGISSAKSYKLCSIPERDRMYIRGALLADIWNEIAEGDRLDIEGTLCELLVNGEYKGLYYLYADRSGFEQYEGALGDEGVVNTADYFAYLQFGYEYDNIQDQVDMTPAGDGIYIKPRRIEAGLGILSEKNGYRAYESENRLILPEECGIEPSRNAEMIEAFKRLKTSVLSAENVNSKIDAYVQQLISSGFIYRYARYELGDDFNENDEFTPADYYMDRVSYFKEYINNRAEYIDECYASGEIRDIEKEAAKGGRISLASSDSENEAKDSEVSKEKLPRSGYLDAAVSFEYAKSKERIEINLFLKDKELYVFLPSGADADSLRAVIYKNNEGLTGDYLKDGDIVRIDDAAIGEKAVSGNFVLHVCQSKKLPAIHVDTYNGTMDYVDAFKGNKEPGSLALYTEAGEPKEKCSLSSVSFRGHGSSNFAKKSYNICADEPISIEGLGSGAKWVLQANALDQSKIRNSMTMQLADELNVPYSQKTAYADLYLNGKYWGNYLIMQPVETGDSRVNINKAAGDQLFEIINRKSRLEDKDIVMTDLDGMIIVFRENDGVDYAAQMFYQEKIREVNRRIHELGDRESYERLKQVLDVDSYAAVYIMDMLSNDIDSGWFSTFFTYKAGDDKLYAGPLWDYDKAYGNQADRGIYPEFDCFYHTWPEILAENEYFMEDVKRIFEEKEPYILAMIDMGADESFANIEASVSMNDIAMPIVSGTVVNLDTPYDSVDYVKKYLKQRYDLLKALIYEPLAYRRVYFEGKAGRVLYVKMGECASGKILDYIADVYGCDGFVDEGGNIFDSDRRVNEDIIVMPKW